ncbi:hypothetical protein H5410_056983 [Solanum commersonii]|uniref:Uncharacterized protein n=1 Tax=Solanum commersonii TaxID=4109 RepID=A0A9J5WLP5_SOLCO|nr:hypothetical protein H5410_056983 [Solanum commersonii]
MWLLEIRGGHHAYGLFVLSYGYDCTSRFIDVEKGREIQVFNEDQVVGVVKFPPNNYNLLLSRGSKGHLKIWNIRVVKVLVRNIKVYDEACVDIVFHLVMFNVVALSSWSGQVSVAET